MHGEIETVALEIVRYFRQSPDTADTLEGIARWRLMQQTIDLTVDETQAALQLLIERGLVEEIRLAGGKTVFRLAADKRAEIAAGIAARDGGPA